MFIVSKMLKSARKDANLTQEQLADKAGTKKTTFPNLKMARQISNFLH
jgi:transcriptional regulator with XRE-family HTH domain